MRKMVFALCLLSAAAAAIPAAPPTPREIDQSNAIVRLCLKELELVRGPEVKVKKFARGAKPTPRHKLLAAPQYKASVAAPAQVAIVPKQLDMWGNDEYGDCVSAEEAFAKACYSPEIFIPAATVVAWAQKRGYRDGADLTEVMDSMRSDGFVVGTQKYNDGGYASVDYSTESVLQNAIAAGPVKIGIDADALPSGAGNDQGWYALGKGSFRNEDHCVALCGYGTATYLYGQLGVPLPAALTGKSGYLLYTWSTIGFVDHAWIMSTVGEAWVRSPTTVGVPPLAPPTPPVPPVPPGPTPGAVTITLTTDQVQSVLAQAGASGLSRDMTLGQILDLIQKAEPKKPK